MKKYEIYTDLACEAEVKHDSAKSGTEYYEETIDGFNTAKLIVKDANGEEFTKKKRGTYITVFCDMIHKIDTERFDALSSLIAKQIASLTENSLKASPSCVLVAGLGNREITADNIGPKAVDKLTVTRHISLYNRKLFDSFSKVPLCAIAPGVLGQTGVETADILMGMCKSASPDLIIAIDALAARSTERLGTTVQISDSGIFPGSGIGNRRNEISFETMGIPVIALGIPTVVNSATLVYDALNKAGCEKYDKELDYVLKSGTSFFVSPRESDMINEKAAMLFAAAINELYLY